VSVAISFPAAAPEGPHLRALRDDADFPYVVIGPGEGYEIVRDEGDVDGAGGALFVNPFEVPPGRDDEFLAAWDAARVPLERCHGFLGRRMHRAVDDAARLRFVNLGRWSSPLMLHRAMQRDDVRAAVEAIAFPSHPALYLPVAEVAPGGGLESG
jgi:heme-degrading monooxygenase HmoA